MSRRALTLVTRTQGANRALKDGDVSLPGVPFETVEVPVLVQGFRRMVRSLEFDVCEMALTTYLCAREHGVAFTALPVFIVRGLHHGAMVTNDPSLVDDPTRLQGIRVGVNRGYTVTTGVWARGILADEYGVDLGAVTWAPTADEHVPTFRRPANVTEAMNAELSLLLASRELAAGVGLTTDDVTADEESVVPLITDPTSAALESLATRELYPINHVIVVRDTLLEESPNLAAMVFEAFVASKQPYLEQLNGKPSADETALDHMYRQVMQVTKRDPLPYGIEANRVMLEKLLDHTIDQGILRHRPEVSALFAPTTHTLVG
jgi:4,5-dihydroxyphthalate decarboxylase